MKKYIFSSYAFSFIKEAKKIAEATGFQLVLGRYNPLSVAGKGLIIGNPDYVTKRIIDMTRRVEFKCYLVLEGILVNKSLLRYYNRFTIIVPSQFVRECFEESGLHVDYVIPHAIPKVNPRPVKFREKARLLYIAWWHNFLPRKYPKEAIEALKLVRYPFELVILTSPNNPYISELRKYGIVMTDVGKLPENELLKLYQSADFYLSFSQSEGFGVPILEAISVGLPVIHVDAKPFTEITTPECSIRFPYDKVILHPCPNFKGKLHVYSAQELANAINEALEIYYNDKAKYLEMCKAGIERAKAFTYPHTYKRFTEIV